LKQAELLGLAKAEANWETARGRGKFGERVVAKRTSTTGRLVLTASSALPALAGGAQAAPAPRPDTYLARVEALALIETLNAEVLGSRSATTTLEAWCAAHAMAVPATLKAKLDKSLPDKPVTDEQRQRLGVGPDEIVKYRNVELSCGPHVLSQADNWYVPSRLSPEMNTTLERTDTSFGRVVASLKPTRQTFSVTLSWHPLPPGWEMAPPSADHPDQTLTIPPILFEHRAVLYAADKLPFSEVHEHYTSEILAFSPQARSLLPKP
jgi:hypothetical protein